MRQVTAPGSRSASPPVAGRWIWRLSGLVTVGLLVASISWATSRAGIPGGPGPMSAVPTRTVAITQPVSSVNVQSYGAPIQITTGTGPNVTVTEAIAYSQADGGPPAVTAAVSGGQLTLDAPDCGGPMNCAVGFAVTLPARVNVTATSQGGGITVAGAVDASLNSGGGPVRATGITGSLVVNAEGGPVNVASIAGANIDSGGGPVWVSKADGPLTVSAEGGSVTLTGLTGGLHADSGGGPLFARRLDAATSTINTEGGNASLTFAVAPNAVQLDTGGGAANLSVPGGPYALTTDAGGGPEFLSISANPAAVRSIDVSTEGGPLRIVSGAAAGPATSKIPAPPQPPPPPKQ